MLMCTIYILSEHFPNKFVSEIRQIQLFQILQQQTIHGRGKALLGHRKPFLNSQDLTMYLSVCTYSSQSCNINVPSIYIEQRPLYYRRHESLPPFKTPVAYEFFCSRFLFKVFSLLCSYRDFKGCFQISFFLLQF